MSIAVLYLFVGVLALFFSTYYAPKIYSVWWLKHYFKIRLKPHEVSPHNVRDEINAMPKTPWQVRYLTRLKYGDSNNYHRRLFLKRFSAYYFGRSERWEKQEGLRSHL